MNNLDQFKQTYITECFELLAEMEERLLGLDVEAADSEALNAIFRCAHSIKGGSGAFGFDFITGFTHVLEALLDAMREGKVTLSREAVDTLLKSVDVVTKMVQAANENRIPPADLGAEIKVRLERLAGTESVQGCAQAVEKPVAGTGGECCWRSLGRSKSPPTRRAFRK